MRTLFLSVLISLIFVGSSLAEDARMDGVRVDYDSELRLSFVVKDAFTQDIEEAIKSGIPTTFTFIVKLHRVRNLWPDKHVGTWEFGHTVKYDTLKEEYELTLEESGRVLTTKDAGEMKRLMVTGLDAALQPKPQLSSGQSYELRLMAELDPVELPFLLDYMLFFVKLWDFETDWHVTTITP